METPLIGGLSHKTSALKLLYWVKLRDASKDTQEN
jgi:hypothetical protein